LAHSAQGRAAEGREAPLSSTMTRASTTLMTEMSPAAPATACWRARDVLHHMHGVSSPSALASWLKGREGLMLL